MPFPVILSYHAKMMDLLNQGKLTADHAKEILRAQSEIAEALYREAEAPAGKENQQPGATR
jgi:hypothetical protein